MPKDPHDRKRKKKLAEKKRKARQAESLAYMGEKYKKNKLIPTWMHTEIGIYETYVMTDRKIFDQTVVSALETLIRKMRTGTLPPLPETAEIHYEVGREEDLLIENIRRSWADHYATEWRPPKDDLIGVLRTILGSIEKVKAPGPRSQSYLRHIAGFLTKQIGVSVKAFSADRKPLPEPEEDELVRLGRQWNTDGNQEARAEFFERATHLMRNGQPSRVIDACHLLTGEVSDPVSEVVAELVVLIQQARESLIKAMS
jgi:hypothetical protein